MSDKTYFVTLMPRQLFFFGGEQGQTADYYVKGSFLPQQTALFGLVRHQILLQNNLMTDNKINNDSKASEAIGEKSFEWNNTAQTFGKLKKISPCYLVCNNEGVSKKFLPYYQPYVKSIKKIGENVFLPEHDPKSGYPDAWMRLDNSNTICNADNFIFDEIERPGVDKNYVGRTEDESDDKKAYYKQVWLKMKKGFSFGFYVTLDEDVIFKLQEVTFGKESSPFLMKISEPISEVEEYTNVANPNAILLTGDTYVSSDVLSLCEFAVTDTVPFRNIVTDTKSSNSYYKLDKAKSDVRLQLLKRGSVLFPASDNLNSITEEINKHANFKKIGYNHFHLLNIPY